MIDVKIIVGDDKTISISGFPNDEIVSLGLVEKVKIMLVDHFKARESKIVRPSAEIPAGVGLHAFPGSPGHGANGGKP